MCSLSSWHGCAIDRLADHLRYERDLVQQGHWSERGRTTSVDNSDVLGAPHRSVLSFAVRVHMIHNRYLPAWLHRCCNGLFGIVACLGIASLGFGSAPGSWLQVGSLWLIYASLPVGAVLFFVAPRFSIVEGLAGGEGYDELDAPESANQSVERTGASPGDSEATKF